MTSAVARYFVLVHRHLLPLVLPREIPPVRYLSAPLALADASPLSPFPLRRFAPFFRFRLVFEVLHCLLLPSGLCVCASLRSGPSSPPPGSGFYRLLLVPEVILYIVTSLWSLRPRVPSSWPFVTTSWPHAASAVSRSQFPRVLRLGAPLGFFPAYADPRFSELY